MIKNIILITLILILIGCQKVEEPKVTAKEAKTTPDISIESDVSDVNSIDNELNTKELDNLESELDEINW